MDRRLPDTPWHVGYSRKYEDDPRRHKARCIYYRFDNTCECVKSPCYMFKCSGSAHCKFYKETEKTIVESGFSKTGNIETDRISNRNKPRKDSDVNCDKQICIDRWYRNPQKKKLTENIVLVKSGINCPFCGKTNVNNSIIILADKDDHFYDIEVKKCDCGSRYLTIGLRKNLPLTLKNEIGKGGISLKRKGLRIISYNPARKLDANAIICPKCNEKCTSLYENKGMCWKCFKKQFRV